MKIGITGSISSGKSTATKFISKGIYPCFSADKVIKKFYKNKSFLNILVRKFKLKDKKNIKNSIKKLITRNKKNIKILEKIIHPLVRKKMLIFSKTKHREKHLIFEIPLLVESKLFRYFDFIIFIGSEQRIRRKRYINSGGNVKLFEFLNKRQIKPKLKEKYCDYLVQNNKTIGSLKKKLDKIMKLYE